MYNLRCCPRYYRRNITNRATWIEIKLNNPLKRLDPVLRVMTSDSGQHVYRLKEIKF